MLRAPRQFCVLIVIATSVFSWCLQADQQSTGNAQSPIKVDAPEVEAHRIGRLEPIVVHLVGGPEEMRNAGGMIPVEVTVDPTGRVISVVMEDEDQLATADVPKQWLPELKRAIGEAKSEIRSLSYRPFERDGHAVAASFEEDVPTIPPDMAPGPHVDFPEVKQFKSLVMSLDRTGCFGMCPAYTIEVHGDGTVLYNGRRFVAIMGKHRGTISQDAVLAMLNAFRRADYFSLRDHYRMGVTDNPTFTTSIRFDGHSKSVEDYVGEGVGMPHAVTELESAIDKIADTERWTKGDKRTLAALQGENWSFKSREAADTLARITMGGSADAVCDLLAAGVAADGNTVERGLGDPADQPHSYPLDAAAFRGNIEMMQCLLRHAPADDPVVLADALSRAAAAGKLDAMKLLLKNGADVNVDAPGSEPAIVAAAVSGIPAVVQEILGHRPDINKRDSEGRTALIAATDRGYQESKAVNRAEVVRMLLAAGADVNARDAKGNTALIENAWDPDVAELLLAAGAEVNAANKDGWTALFSASNTSVTRVLLQHGADIGFRNKDGKTAMQQAKEYGNPEIVKLLEAAEAGKVPNSK